MNIRDIKSVKICSTIYEIIFVTELKNEKGRELRGLIVYGEDRIYICTNYPVQRQLQALMHEVFHGLAEEYGLPNEEDEVNLYSNAMYCFMFDNPKVMNKWVKFNKGVAKSAKI